MSIFVKKTSIKPVNKFSKLYFLKIVNFFENILLRAVPIALK